MIVDLTVLEYMCNLACAYCRGYFGFNAGDKRDGDSVLFTESLWRRYCKNPVIADYRQSILPTDEMRLPIAVMIDAAKLALSEVEAALPVDLVKLSGGEITLFPEVLAALLKRGSKTPCKILSNGVLLKASDVIAWAESDRLSAFQASLDGIDSNSNRYRFSNMGRIEALLCELEAISAHGIPLEINTVISNASIDGYLSLVQWAASLPGKVTLFPRPVRNIPDNRFFPSPEQVVRFEETVLCKQCDYRHLFQSDEYLQILLVLLKRAPARSQCIVPAHVVAVSASGEINACTIGGTPALGNFFENPDVLRLYAERQRSLATPWPVCSECLCEYELFNTNRSGLKPGVSGDQP